MANDNRRGPNNRQGQNNNKNRGRSRGRRQQNPTNRSYESNGPDVKIRGNASTIVEKYTTLARDAQLSGDRVKAENYMQHAEHYQRIVNSFAPPAEQRDTSDGDDADAEGQDPQAADAGDTGAKDVSAKEAKDENVKPQSHPQAISIVPLDDKPEVAENDAPAPAQDAKADADTDAREAEAVEEAPKPKVRRTRKPRVVKPKDEAKDKAKEEAEPEAAAS